MDPEVLRSHIFDKFKEKSTHRPDHLASLLGQPVVCFKQLRRIQIQKLIRDPSLLDRLLYVKSCGRFVTQRNVVNSNWSHNIRQNKSILWLPMTSWLCSIYVSLLESLSRFVPTTNQEGAPFLRKFIGRYTETGYWKMILQSFTMSNIASDSHLSAERNFLPKEKIHEKWRECG